MNCIQLPSGLRICERKIRLSASTISIESRYIAVVQSPEMLGPSASMFKVLPSFEHSYTHIFVIIDQNHVATNFYMSGSNPPVMTMEAG